jgi:hypothetical protein
MFYDSCTYVMFLDVLKKTPVVKSPNSAASPKKGKPGRPKGSPIKKKGVPRQSGSAKTKATPMKPISQQQKKVRLFINACFGPKLYKCCSVRMYNVPTQYGNYLVHTTV